MQADEEDLATIGIPADRASARWSSTSRPPVVDPMAAVAEEP